MGLAETEANALILLDSYDDAVQEQRGDRRLPAQRRRQHRTTQLGRPLGRRGRIVAAAAAIGDVVVVNCGGDIGDLAVRVEMRSCAREFRGARRLVNARQRRRRRRRRHDRHGRRRRRRRRRRGELCSARRLGVRAPRARHRE